MTESHIEKKVTKYAESIGWVSFKWAPTYHSGLPDRLFFKTCTLIIIEFKAPGKTASKLQEYVHNKLGEAGFNVHVIDNVEDGYALFA